MAAKRKSQIVPKDKDFWDGRKWPSQTEQVSS